MAFHIEDLHPNVAIGDIEPMQDRIRSLVARRSPLETNLDDNVRIAGSLRIVEGLSYHFNRYEQLTSGLNDYLERHRTYAAQLQAGANQSEVAHPALASKEEALLLGHLHHESMAYFNRLGQFYYFAKAFGSTDPMPRISELVWFRHKHSAHRSIDQPRDEAVHERRLQAISVGLTHTLSNGVPVIHLNLADTFLRFTFQEDHPVVLNEIFAFYQLALAP